MTRRQGIGKLAACGKIELVHGAAPATGGKLAPGRAVSKGGACRGEGGRRLSP